jgi:hypothetical protein
MMGDRAPSLGTEELDAFCRPPGGFLRLPSLETEEQVCIRTCKQARPTLHAGRFGLQLRRRRLTGEALTFPASPQPPVAPASDPGCSCRNTCSACSQTTMHRALRLANSRLPP